MAEKVDEIHSTVTGDLSDKIQEVHAIVLAIAEASPRLNPRDSRASDLPVWDSPLLDPMPESLRNSYHSRTTTRTPQRSPEIAPLDGASRSNSTSYPRRRFSRRESDMSTAPSLSEASDRRSSAAYSIISAAAVPDSPGPIRRPSTTHWRIDKDLPTVRDENEAEEQQVRTTPSRSPSLRQQQQQKQRTDSRLSFTSPILPSPAIPPDPDPDAAGLLRKPSLGSAVTADSEKILLERAGSTRSQQDAFERAAFRDSAILREL